jgi:uncharacterized protein (TIGR02646 family)
MRFINFERVQARITEEWLQKAARNLCAVEGLPPKERKEAIKRRSEVWRDLAGFLSDASHGKCWYCESREDRSHNPVDHFRPKSAVDECKEHEGYWWLAFDWRNYRFCCTYCNSALKDIENDSEAHGKQDHFPLLNPETRAMTRIDNLDREDPTLLDPIRSRDTKLLIFDMWGKAIERHLETEDQEEYARAHLSIDIYHLNHPKIRKSRMVLYNRIKSLVDEGCRKRKILDETPGLPRISAKELKTSIDEIDQSLAQLMSEDAEYSSAARCYAMSLRGLETEWLDELLRTV